MASGVYNVRKGHQGEDWPNDDNRCILVDYSFLFDKDHDFLNDTTSAEITGTGYVRKTLAGEAVTIDQANDQAEHDATDVTWTSANFDEWVKGAVVYVYNASDAAAALTCYVETTSTTASDGVATSGDATFTSAGASWSGADVGAWIEIDMSGGTVARKIASINSSTSIELDATLGASESSKTYRYGGGNTNGGDYTFQWGADGVYKGT